MLDLLSGAFACSVLIFVMFATLMGADAASESGFLHLEGTIAYVDGRGEKLPHIILRVDPLLIDPVSKYSMAAAYRSDEERYPSGILLGEVPTSDEIDSAADDTFSRFARSALVAGPHLSGVSIDKNGQNMSSTSIVHFRRAAGSYIVTMQILPTQPSRMAAETTREVKATLTAYFSDRGRIRVASLSHTMTLDALINTPVFSPTEARTALDAVGEVRSVPSPVLAHAGPGTQASERRVVDLLPVGSLPSVLQFIVEVGPDE